MSKNFSFSVVWAWLAAGIAALAVTPFYAEAALDGAMGHVVWALMFVAVVAAQKGWWVVTALMTGIGIVVISHVA